MKKHIHVYVTRDGVTVKNRDDEAPRKSPFKVIPYRYYWNKTTGKKASVHGAHPGEGWELRQDGYTILNTRTNTSGVASMPAGGFRTEAEAWQWVEKENKRMGYES